MNVRVLTRDEREYLNKRYTFVLDDKHIHVKVNGYNRITVHSVNESINITCSMRRMTLTAKAIAIWSRLFVDKHSLIDVQNAINYLKVSYQEVTNENVEKALVSIAQKDAERHV